MAYLPDLVRFGIAAITLQVQPFNDTLFSEYVVAPPCSFRKSQADQQSAQVAKSNVGVRLAGNDPLLQPIITTVVRIQLSTLERRRPERPQKEPFLRESRLPMATMLKV